MRALIARVPPGFNEGTPSGPPTRPISRTSPICSIATPRCVATSSCFKPSSTVRPPSAACTRIRPSAVKLTRTRSRSERRFRHTVQSRYAIRIVTAAARIRCAYSMIMFVSITGTARPPQSGQPSVPLPAAPQPRPESLIRTTPPTTIRANVSAAVR